MRDRVAVTGSAGFIGRAVTEQLEQHDVDVVGVDRQDGNDILTAPLSRHFDGCRTVIHLAGVLGTAELFDDPAGAVDVNVKGTLRVLEACRDVEAGYVGITMHDAFPSVYTATKLAAQRIGSGFHNAYGVPVSHVRAYNAFGPGQAHGTGHPRKIVPAFATEAWNGQPITIWGDGTQTVDLIHTDELARVLVEATRVGDDSVIDAGTGEPWTVNEVAARVIAVTGSRAGTVHLPMRRGEIPTQIAAKGEGWEHLTRPPHFSWEQFDETVESYR